MAEAIPETKESTDPNLVSQAIDAYARIAIAQAASPKSVQGAVATAVPLSVGNQPAPQPQGMSTTAVALIGLSVLLVVGALAVRFK